MSSPHVIIAAVHELDGSHEDWWDEHEESLDGFDENDVEPRWNEGLFKSTEVSQEFPVKVAYHSSRGEDVIEIVLSGKSDIQEVAMTGLEDIIDEINYRFDCDFTLEVYYWYDGVDKPGAKS